MKRYIALLRGINVGGNNQIKMDKLQESFLSLGFKNVSTYINSGNVIFDTDLKNEGKLVTLIEEKISKDFDLQIPIVVRDAKNIEKICQSIPTSWTNDKDQKTDIMFLWEEYAAKDIVEKLPIKEVDTVRYIDGCCVWHIKKCDYKSSGLNDLIKSKLYKSMTVRNVNTVRKINERMQS